MTIDNLNKLMTLANHVGWKTIVVGRFQYEDGKDMTYSGAPIGYCMWNSPPFLKEFKLKIVDGDCMGIEP